MPFAGAVKWVFGLANSSERLQKQENLSWLPLSGLGDKDNA
jgi:hypothetical protein